MINYSQPNFFEHLFKVVRLDLNTRDFIYDRFSGKSLLHVGCVDSMHYSKDDNLHIELSKRCPDIVGFDIDIDGLHQLQEDCPSTYYHNFDDVLSRQYDVVLVPEVIEHVWNVGEFVDSLAQIDTKEYFVSAPYIGLFPSNISHDGETLRELVHADHKCWHSPYTLYNVFRKIIDAKSSPDMCDLYILKNNSSVVLHIRTK